MKERYEPDLKKIKEVLEGAIIDSVESSLESNGKLVIRVRPFYVKHNYVTATLIAEATESGKKTFLEVHHRD
jgi:hypothetical protein